MRVRHPYTLQEDSPPLDDYVHYGGRRELAAVDDDGTFEIPDDRRGFVDQLAERHDVDAEALLVGENAENGAPADASEETFNSSATLKIDVKDDEQPGRDPEYVADGLCGYYDPEEMDGPCSRPAGWGTDNDGGTCRDHPDEDGEA